MHATIAYTDEYFACRRPSAPTAPALLASVTSGAQQTGPPLEVTDPGWMARTSQPVTRTVDDTPANEERERGAASS